jgi:hypothetical protein
MTQNSNDDGNSHLKEILRIEFPINQLVLVAVITTTTVTPHVSRHVIHESYVK